jgi:hypothetical protein
MTATTTSREMPQMGLGACRLLEATVGTSPLCLLLAPTHSSESAVISGAMFSSWDDFLGCQFSMCTLVRQAVDRIGSVACLKAKCLLVRVKSSAHMMLRRAAHYPTVRTFQ